MRAAFYFSFHLPTCCLLARGSIGIAHRQFGTQYVFSRRKEERKARLALCNDGRQTPVQHFLLRLNLSSTATTSAVLSRKTRA